MNRKFAPAILSLVLALVTPASAFAFAITNLGGKIVCWDADNVDWVLDADGFSGISDGSDREAVIDSFNDWQAVSCSYLTFTRTGNTSVGDVLPTGASANGINEFIWKEGEWPFSQYTLGVTSPLYGYEGEIVEADIALNGSRSWNTVGQCDGTMDVKSVAIHELGHLFGLQHPLSFDDWDPPTMAPYVNQDGKTATLHQDDMNGICYLYPVTGSYTCSDDSECPNTVSHYENGDEYTSAWYSCVSGTCVWDNPVVLPDQVDVGGWCDDMSDCKAPLFCLQTQTGSFCSRWCPLEASDCPSGYQCADMNFGSEGICVEIGSMGDGNQGDLCWTNLDCNGSLVCQTWYSGNFCTSTCTGIGSPVDCPDGYVCMESDIGLDPEGACFPGKFGDRELGEACDQAIQCQSQFCFPTPNTEETACRLPCTVGGDECPSGSLCVPAPWDELGSQGGCIPTTSLPHKGTGMTCSLDWECDSGYCFLDKETNTSTCREPCTPGVGFCLTTQLCVNDGHGGGACLDTPDEPLSDDSPCTHHHECTSGYCAPIPGASLKFCRNTCTDPWGCGTGYLCIFFEGPDLGICMPELEATDAPCYSSTECTSQICWSQEGPSLCRNPCVLGTCDPGYECHLDTPYGPLCLPASHSLELGANCHFDEQCIEGDCVDGVCELPFSPPEEPEDIVSPDVPLTEDMATAPEKNQPDSDLTAPPQKGGGGCSTGPAGGTDPAQGALMLLVALFFLALRKKECGIFE